MRKARYDRTREWMVNTGSSLENVGPLTRKVLDYVSGELISV